MIEMVYNGKESKGQSEVRLPKNIRQIGDNNSKKICNEQLKKGTGK